MNIGVFIAYLIVEFFQVIVCVIGFGVLSKTEKKFSKMDIFKMFIFSIFILLNNLYMILELRTFIALLLLLLLNKIMYNESIKKTIITSLILFTIILVCELLISTVFLNKFKSVETLNNHLWIKIFLSSLDSVIILLIFKIKKVLKNLEKIKININCTVMLLIVVLLLNGFIIMRSNKPDNIFIIVIIITCVLLMLGTIKIIINEKYNIEVLKEKNKCLQDSYRAYYDTVQECSTFKHNLKNALYSLKAKLPSEYQKNFDTIVFKYMKDFDWINNIVDIPEGLQGVIYLKIKEAKAKNVNIVLDCEKNIDINDKDYVDICETVGIILDNAIHASIVTKSKTLLIEISEDNQFIKIRIINTFLNQIDLDEITKKHYSTKKRKSGIGLNYISELKNKKINVSYEIVNNLFISRIIYKK